MYSCHTQCYGSFNRESEGASLPSTKAALVKATTIKSQDHVHKQPFLNAVSCQDMLTTQLVHKE